MCETITELSIPSQTKRLTFSSLFIFFFIFFEECSHHPGPGPLSHQHDLFNELFRF